MTGLATVPVNLAVALDGLEVGSNAVGDPAVGALVPAAYVRIIMLKAINRGSPEPELRLGMSLGLFRLQYYLIQGFDSLLRGAYRLTSIPVKPAVKFAHNVSALRGDNAV